MNAINVNPQLVTIEAAILLERNAIYRVAMLEPHTSSELSIDDIISLCDDLIEVHMFGFRSINNKKASLIKARFFANQLCFLLFLG